MNKDEDIRKIKEEWAREFGHSILDDQEGNLPENWLDLKKKLHDIPGHVSSVAVPDEHTTSLPSWLWPLMAAAALVVGIWIFVPTESNDTQEIDWAILDEVEASELYLALEESYIYDLASINHEDLEGINEYNIEDETIEDWLEYENDILLWVE
jgi:hypothetical protein